MSEEAQVTVFKSTGRFYRQNLVKATCHPERAHVGKGLCKQCYSQYYYKVNKSDPEFKLKRTERNWRKHNIKFSVVEYKKLLEKQANVCAICKKTPEDNGKALAVDHDHKTNRIRGLLCYFCNGNLASHKVTIQMLLNAADYLIENDKPA